MNIGEVSWRVPRSCPSLPPPAKLPLLTRLARYRTYKHGHRPCRARIRPHPLGEAGSQNSKIAVWPSDGGFPLVSGIGCEPLASRSSAVSRLGSYCPCLCFHRWMPRLFLGFQIPHWGRDPSLRSPVGCPVSWDPGAAVGHPGRVSLRSSSPKGTRAEPSPTQFSLTPVQTAACKRPHSPESLPLPIGQSGKFEEMGVGVPSAERRGSRFGPRNRHELVRRSHAPP